MKKTIKVPYALKKLALGASVVALPVFTSCERDKDPIQERIEQLTALEKLQANEVRAAVQPAKTQPNNITSVVNDNFEMSAKELNNKWPAANIYDSALVFVGAVNIIERDFGNPIPKNDATLKNLRTKSQNYIATVKELNELQK